MTKKYGKCYEAAGKLFMDLAMGFDKRFPPEMGSVTLVHGLPTLTVYPFMKYGHAWLEIGDAFCYDAERDMLVPRGMFYEAGAINPSECERYDLERMRERVKQHGHWGPWDAVGGLSADDPDSSDR